MVSTKYKPGELTVHAVDIVLSVGSVLITIVYV
jgi:hypothetical protein